LTPGKKKRLDFHFAAAFREAGHAVSAWDRNVMLMPVSIFARGAGAGQNVWNDAVRNVDFDWLRSAKSAVLAERLASILLAGPLAQRMFMPNGPKGPAHMERLRQAKTLLSAVSTSPGGSRAYYERVRRDVGRFLVRSDVKETVGSVAKELLEKGTITGKEMTALIETRMR
jgi:hypothetical protein